MSPDTTLALFILGPPAAFGILVAAEEWTNWVQGRRRAHTLQRASMDRHPSRPVGPEDDPAWGQR
jgi:hypothetical protein